MEDKIKAYPGEENKKTEKEKATRGKNMRSESIWKIEYLTNKGSKREKEMIRSIGKRSCPGFIAGALIQEVSRLD